MTRKYNEITQEKTQKTKDLPNYFYKALNPFHLNKPAIQLYYSS